MYTDEHLFRMRKEGIHVKEDFQSPIFILKKKILFLVFLFCFVLEIEGE